MDPTFVVVLSVFAVFLERKRTVDSIPAVVAAAFKETFTANSTLAVA